MGLRRLDEARRRLSPGRVRALGLAWPADGPGDPLVMAAARQELIHFGHHALPALRRTIREVDPLYSADVLASKLRPDQLRFLVFFSSVSGRFGNAGQSDYSAANEYLNKLADQLNNRWPTRVVSVNWGPWDAGMVSDELRQMYASKGIGMIPIREGVESLAAELRASNDAPAEVAVSCSLDVMISVST